MSLIFDCRPLVVNPDLAVKIGLNEAIILQQIHYWIKQDRSGKEHENRRWIYNTYEGWREQFPFLSTSTIKRCLTNLKDMGYLDVEQLNKKSHDRTNFYTINYDLLNQVNDDHSIRSDWPHPQDQNEPISLEISSKSSSDTLVDSAESDSESAPNPTPKKPKIPPCPIREIIGLWSEIMPDKKQPMLNIWLQNQNGENLKNRWSQCFRIKHSREDRMLYHDLESGLEFWRLFFIHIRKSEFLMSDNKFFDLGWVVKKINFEKILENKYHG